MSLTLKDHRFNRLNDSSLSPLYHLDDIANYLERFSNIVNGITIIDRSFVEMEILKPIFAAISLLGIHITRTFHALLLDKQSNYSTLLNSFQLLYDDLTMIDATDFLTTRKECKFVADHIFNHSLPERCLLDALEQHIKDYPEEIKQILHVALKMFADRFAHQKGTVFGRKNRTWYFG